ncbi:hypothetical protein [Nocardia jejuensis]|uniref:hypothetical protein n=1 Tax=Nocardia jejuensis TaxID=328049 RepID=UPI00082BA5C2|nr:hypothetical protein [Nocardia jejuensis]
MTDRASGISALLRTAAVALAATGALALSAYPAATAQPTTSPGVSAPVLERNQGWLKMSAGIAPANANAVQLKVENNPTVGPRVTDKDGRSLYRFDKDTADPSKSNCAGDCAVTWPPLLVTRGQTLYVQGIDLTRTGFIERADGTCQITVGGWPVYYFAKDQNPGDLKGQGVGGTWFAVAPDGGRALAK